MWLKIGPSGTEIFTVCLPVDLDFGNYFIPFIPCVNYFFSLCLNFLTITDINTTSMTNIWHQVGILMWSVAVWADAHLWQDPWHLWLTVEMHKFCYSFTSCDNGTYICKNWKWFFELSLTAISLYDYWVTRLL